MRKAALVGHREGDTRAAFCSGMYCKGVKRHAKYACRIGGVRWMRETIWLDEKNKKTAKQVAAVLAEAKATCSDVRAILQAVWDYLGVTVCEDGDA